MLEYSKFWVPIESEIFMHKLNKMQLFLRKYENEIRAKILWSGFTKFVVFEWWLGNKY